MNITRSTKIRSYTDFLEIENMKSFYMGVIKSTLYIALILN